MDLEFHQIDRRYEGLRKTSPQRERRLIGSLAQVGQQTPVVVVAPSGGGDRLVLLDGYKRVRALQRLRHDTVFATRWELPESEALLLERLMRSSDGDGPLEQGWFLRELRDRFGIVGEELARRFDRSPSWVSRRLALAADLPAEAQDLVRRGNVPAHAAMKYLVPLARANRDDCVRLCAAMASLRPSSREVGALYAAYAGGDEKARGLLLADPGLFLRAQAEARRADTPAEQKPIEQLLGDLAIVASVARRAQRRLLRPGTTAALTATERDEARRCLQQTRADVEPFFIRLDAELSNARPDNA